MEITTITPDDLAALSEVHRAQLAALAEPWFGQAARTAEEFFQVMGEEFGQDPDELEVDLSRITDEQNPDLVLFDYWYDGGTGTGSYYFANSTDDTGCYKVQHYHDGRPLADALPEARERAKRHV